jgi:hypothetical protein
MKAHGPRMTRRLFIAFVALIAAWLGVASESSAAEFSPQFSAATYTYDGHQGSDAPTQAVNERGPPVAYDRDTTYNAGDRWPRGALARPSGLSLPAVTTYNSTARLAQGDNPRTTTRQHDWVSARSISSFQRLGVAANTGTRLAQDIAVSPLAPRALGLGRSIGRASHNQALQADIAALPRGATGIRVNQQQVNALGQRVGINRPDLQYTLNGQRYYVEYEGLANPRGALHEARTLANDPGANFILRIVP